MRTNRRDARLLRGGEQVARAVDHHALELLRLALPDRDEVDDRVAALDGGAQARRHRSRRPATSSQPQASSVRRPARSRTSAAHVAAVRAQRVDDVAADEAGAAGDEDHVAARARSSASSGDGVGPCWPWYFEPSSPAAVRRLGGLGQLDERELADLHPVVDRDREVGDVRELERHVPVPAGVDEAGGGVDEQAEPAEELLPSSRATRSSGSRDPLERRAEHELARVQDERLVARRSPRARSGPPAPPSR